MNGDIVAVLNHTKLTPPGEDEKSIMLIQEERFSIRNSQQNDERKEEDNRTNTITMPRDSKNWCPPCWSDEQLSPPQRYCSQTCLPSQTESMLPQSNGICHSLLLNDTVSTLHQRQRRKVRPKSDRKKTPQRIAAGKNVQNRKVTDYYPIRRSSRKSKTVLEGEEKKLIDDLITKGIEEGMEVQHIDGKGRAVFATRCFQKGEYVVEYHGDLLEITDAKKREAEYAQNPATGCYMYYFQYLCKTYCVDATKETGRMGRLINHSKNGNCQTKLHNINGVPHLILVASRDIDEGEELLYDYGDRSKASIAAHPWLKY